MADESVTKTQKAKSSRSARLGDWVFLWVEEGGELKPRPAILADHSTFSNLFSLVVTTPQGANIPYPAIPWSEKPKSFHWTFTDVVKPIQVDAAPVVGGADGEVSESRDI